MPEKESYRQIQARAIERRSRGEPLSVDPTTKEQRDCYDSFYPGKTINPPRVNFPPTSPGVRMGEEFYRRQSKVTPDVSPYGELKADNPKVVELATSLKISTRTFIDNVTTFKKYVDRYQSPKKR